MIARCILAILVVSSDYSFAFQRSLTGNHGIPPSTSVYRSPWAASNTNMYMKTSATLHSSSSGEENYIVGRSKREQFIRLTPLWTIVAAAIATRFPTLVSNAIGDLSSMQAALGILMMSMGVTITPKQLQNAGRQPTVLVLNVLCCFGLMPLLAVGMTRGLDMTQSQTVGTVLLGCVSGGQASNLFTLLAGGDVALSVICTLSTTLLGAVLTPWLVKLLLGGASIATDPFAMLQSAVQFVLIPLLSGLLLGQLVLFNPRQRTFFQRYCPLAGVLATLTLVAGGASNALVASGGWTKLFACSSSSFAWKATLGSTVALPVLGAVFSSWMVRQFFPAIPSRSRRALVIEVLSKSPTLAHVLACKHFGASAAILPATAMVTLAVLGALQASIYARIPLD
jgi:BASS family bile acid:Na+ symporter